MADKRIVTVDYLNSEGLNKDYINNNFANALKGSKSGSVFLIDDVSPVTHEMDVKVRCKNLLSAMSLYPTVTNNAIPIHFKAGQKYTISFKTTYTAWRLMFFGTDKNGTAFDGSKPDANKYISGMYTGTIGRLQHASNQSGNTLTFTCYEDCIITAIVFWNLSNETDKTYSDFQLELGATATSYTPYVDLTAVTVSRCGKNLIPYPYYETTKTQNGITFTDNGDGSVTVNGTASSAAVFQFYNSVGGSKPMNVANKTITISGCPSGGSLQSYFLLFSYGGNSYQDLGNGITKTPNADITAVQLRIAAGATVNNLTFRPQIELGTTKTDYEPYKGVEYTPTADGTVNGVTSLYPNTTLMTDTDGVIIDCEYSRDINKAFAELQQAIISLGGNV